MSTQKALTAESEFPPLQKDKLRVYSMRFCPYAQRTRIMLAHKHINHEVVNINLSSKPTWFTTKITPFGQVPVLQINDKIVYDSQICNAYLDEVYPGERLIPSDPYLRAKDKMLMEHYGKITGPYYKWLFDGDGTETPKVFKKTLKVFEEELEKRKSPFFGGDMAKNIDFLIWPHIECIESLAHIVKEFTITTAEFPNMRRWIMRIVGVPAVRETITTTEDHIRIWEGVKAGNGFNNDLGIE